MHVQSRRILVTLSAAIGLISGVSTRVCASPAIAADASSSTDGLSSVYVEGRRDSLNSLQSSASVIEIGPSELSATGANNVMDALQRLVPSVNIPLGAANTYSSARAARSISIHGLGTDETLILIDGQRQHHSALVNTYMVFGRGTQSVDLDTIPLSAIDHIEILSGGAATQYGSDAIGGVVNIVLKKENKGGDLGATVGVYPAKDKPDGIPRPSTLYQGSIGTSWAEDGYFHLSSDVENSYHPREGYPDNRQYYFAGDPREATVNRSQWCTCSFPASENSYKVNATLGRPISATVDTYAFFNYAHTFKQALGFTTLPSSDANVRAITPNGYQGDSDSTVNDYTGAIGARYDGGSLGKFDLSGNYGVYDQSLYQANAENAALGLATPIGFYLGAYVNTEANVDLTWKRSIAFTPGWNPLDLAAGISYRNEKYQQKLGEYASYATGGVVLDGPDAGKLAPSGGGISPQDRISLTRNVESFWLNAETNLSEEFLIGTALRVENYSDFDTIHSEKGWARYKPAANWSITADISTGFRAPTLGQEGYTSTSYTAFNGAYLQTRALAVTSPAAQALGARKLQPEDSTSYNIGTTWAPDESSSILIDAFSTTINNRITFTDTLTGARVTQIMTAAGYPQISGVNFFVNALDTITRGADFTGKKSFDLGDLGIFNLSLGFSWNITEISHLNPNPSQLAGSGLVLVDRRIQGLYTHATPNTKTVLGANWTRGGWGVGIDEKRYGTYEDFDPTKPANDEVYPVQWITDLSVQYAFQSGFYIVAGADNLFDSHPGIVKNKSLSVQGLGLNKYSDLAPEGMDGTYLHLKVGFKF